MYTTMHAFHWFFKEKHCTLIVYITEFSLKIGGGANTLLPPPPNLNWGGGHGPLAPPIADPMASSHCLRTLHLRTLHLRSLLVAHIVVSCAYCLYCAFTLLFIA